MMSDTDDSNAVDSDDDVMEFVPSKRKFAYTTFGDEENIKRPPPKKDVATYGVFMDSEDEEDDRFTSRRKHHLSSKAPPMFVKQSEEPKVEEEQTQQAPAPAPAPSEPVETEEEKELKKAREAANAKFMELLDQARSKKRSRHQFEQESSIAEKAEQNVPGTTGLGFGAQQAAESNESTTQDAPQMGLGMSMAASSFGMAPPPRIRKDPNLGKWEKHTKGIGMKLLTKMGYKGSGGLGSNRRKKKKADDSSSKTETKKGISQPVQVVVRPNNLGLGFGNFKEASKLKVNKQIEAEVRGVELPKPKQTEKEIVAPSSALPSTKSLMDQESWRRTSSSRKRRKREIVTAAELLAKQEEQPKIIDMRGPSSATQETSQQPQEVPLGEELLHNVTFILNTYENKLRSTSHFVQSTRRKLHSIESSIKEIDERKRKGQERIDKMQVVLKIMDQIEAILQSTNFEANGKQSSAKIQTLVQELGSTFTPEERETLNFYTQLAPSLLQPVIEAQVQGWDPLTCDANTTKELVQSVIDLCGVGEGSIAMKRSLFAKQVLPKVKRSFESTKWDPMTNVHKAVSLYEAIMYVAKTLSPEKQVIEDDNHVLPTFDVSNYDGQSPSAVDTVELELVHDTIHPKLSRCLGAWKPSLDQTGEHLEDNLESWILPWFPHLDHRAIIPSLLADVKRKLKSAVSFLLRKVTSDQAAFRAALETLTPWRSVLKAETLQDIVTAYVSPRLARYLGKLPLKRNAEDENWDTICMPMNLYAKGLLSDQEFMSLIEGELLPNWARTLHKWLVSSDELSEEMIVGYYLNWKSKLLLDAKEGGSHYGEQNPNDLLRNDSMICRFFYGGLAMIQASLVHHDISKLKTTLVPSTSNYKVVVARRAKDAKRKAQRELNMMEKEANQDERGFHTTASHRREVNATFRDVVEDYAREQNVSFHPRLGGKSTKDGKQIFLFGSIPVYLDSNVVFALQQTEWKPLSLEQLGSLAKATVAT